MIVYGDPQRVVSASELISHLQQALPSRSKEQETPPNLDHLRHLLIQVGLLEQAVEDWNADAENEPCWQDFVWRVRHITDLTADCFLFGWLETQDHPCSASPASGQDFWNSRTALQRELSSLHLTSDVALTFKIPEGFAFYALFPEQYCLAALNWAAEHDPQKADSVLIVGVRSIGTALSAIVRATLQRHGFTVHRATVRPSGHPYSRTVEGGLGHLLAHRDSVAEWGIVVDEGPGISGSSMAAVVEGLRQAGMSASQISLMPGHAGSPGNQSSERVQQIWSETSRYTVSPYTLRWHGQSLTENLAARTPALLKSKHPVTEVLDLSGGQWRRSVYSDQFQWPAVCAPFESAKLLCRLADGQAVLWKFTGLISLNSGTECETEGEISEEIRNDTAISPLGSAFGYTAFPWISGTPLSCADAAHSNIIDLIARHVVSAAKAPLIPQEQHASLMRLQEMLYWNTWEGVGALQADLLRDWSAGKISQWSEIAMPSSGDGHLAPHEWIRIANGNIVKVDCTGHDLDHTIVGSQPLVWDIAGAISEWNWDQNSISHFLRQVEHQSGAALDFELLLFYRAAYAAFRLGQTTLCAQMGQGDPEEQTRLEKATDRYRRQLERIRSDLVKQQTEPAPLL